MAAPVDRDVRRLVGADAQRLVGHYYLSLNEQDMVKRVVARVRLSVAGIDVQNVYGALCRFHWDEVRAVAMLERVDGRGLAEVVTRRIEEHEYPVSQAPYDDRANFTTSFAILTGFLNHLKAIVGDEEVDALSVKLVVLLVGRSRPAYTAPAAQASAEERDSERNKTKRFNAYEAGPFLHSFPSVPLSST